VEVVSLVVLLKRVGLEEEDQLVKQVVLETLQALVHHKETTVEMPQLLLVLEEVVLVVLE
jgi:hypothetical protein